MTTNHRCIASLLLLAGTEASAQITLASDLAPGQASSFPHALAAFGNQLFFVADNGAIGNEVWRIAQPGAAATLFLDALPGAQSSEAGQMNALPTRLLFTAITSIDGSGTERRTLFTTNGSSAPEIVASFGGGGFGNVTLVCPTVVGARLFFGLAAESSSTGSPLYRSEGNAGDATLVLPVSSSPSMYCDGRAAQAGGELVFVGDHRLVNDNLSHEPWASDGSDSGTHSLGDLRPGQLGSFPHGFIAVGSLAFFTASNVFGRELWRTDGTAGGTVRLSDRVGADGIKDEYLDQAAALGNMLLFACEIAGDGTQLCRSDGTESGTSRVRPDLFLAGSPIVAAGGQVWFAGNLTGMQTALFRSDGSGGGTMQIGGPTAGIPQPLLGLPDGTLYFAQADGLGNELWRVGGPFGDTPVRVMDLEPGPGGSDPEQLTVVGDRIYFSAQTTANGRELYVIGAGVVDGIFGNGFE